MKRIKPDGTPAFQGDVMFRRVNSLPPGAVAAEPRKGGTIVALSETHHHHIATGGSHSYFTMPNDPMRAFIVAKGPVTITHHRSTDTHEVMKLLGDGHGEVVWEIGRQREYTPEGWRRVED